MATSSLGIWTAMDRLMSFQVEHKAPTKRRASTRRGSSKRTSTAKAQPVMTWPHEHPSPIELAKAGFYYTPTAKSDDNVTCFLCNKSLNGWETDDNPILEHLTHSPACAWAINEAIAQRSGQEDRNEVHPQDEVIKAARRATFADRWPHDGKKGWACKTEKMVEAGFYYTPTPESNDFVTCPYCMLSLDGWEPKDKPLDEHRKRGEDCLFFQMVNKKAKQTSRASKGGKKRTSEVLETEIESQPVARPMKRRNTRNARTVSATSQPPAVPSPPRTMDEEDVAMTIEEPQQTQMATPSDSPQPSPKNGPAMTEFTLSPTQSSNAENHTPVPTPQKPAKAAKTTKAKAKSVRIPLAEARTPATPPSKRNLPKTTHPWTAVDLHTIFLDVPANGQENVDMMIIDEATKKTMDFLTSPEKKMTVEEWIRYNARLGEQQLRADCEKIVAAFEREGQRALQTLQGLVTTGRN